MNPSQESCESIPGKLWIHPKPTTRRTFLEEHKKIEISKATNGFSVATPNQIFGDSSLGKVLQSCLEARIGISDEQTTHVSPSQQPEPHHSTASLKRRADFEESECSQQLVESKKLCNHLENQIWKSEPKKYFEKLVEFDIVPVRISSESFDVVSLQFTLTIDVIKGSFPVKCIKGEDKAYLALLELLEQTFGAALTAFNEDDSHLYDSTALDALKPSNKVMSFLIFYLNTILQ